jgi:hypothetical protein
MRFRGEVSFSTWVEVSVRHLLLVLRRICGHEGDLRVAFGFVVDKAIYFGSYWDFNLVRDVFRVSWKDLAIILIIILGVVLFLYGSNYYNAVYGWSGLFLTFAGITGYVAREVYGALRKKRKLETVQS